MSLVYAGMAAAKNKACKHIGLQAFITYSAL